ncbi:hypothetical protein [Ruminococcus sp.]|uniref:hypothetical protein n=1 Tax=Ruminococcus sp. TaxID=41978 RepID=UPI002E80B6BA|nr:hypothetical protein [Ruminococcus sp.]MEE3492254.1 hypothetical protein [Ruminococcus sp.]
MNSQKQNRHSLMAKGIMVLLSLLVLVFIFTMAWFLSQDHPATANGLSLKTESGAEVDVAVGFSTPATGSDYMVSGFTDDNNPTINFERIVVPRSISLGNTTINNSIAAGKQFDTYNLLEDFVPIDLTGNGVELYRPEMESKNKKINYSKDQLSINPNEVVANKQYISFDLYTRSTQQNYRVSLDTGSYVVGAVEVNDQLGLADLAERVSAGTITPSVSDINPSDLIGSNVKRLSKYGSFSEDSVVGAVRAGFTQYTVPNNTSLANFFNQGNGVSLSLDPAKSRLWIPRSDIYLQANVLNGEELSTGWNLYKYNDSVWTTTTPTIPDTVLSNALTTGRTGTYTYEQAAKEHWYYDRTKITSTPASTRYTQVSNPIITPGTGSNDTVIINANSSMFDGTYYYGKCRVNLWIEGCDAEARRAIDGGAFFFGFTLSAN